MFAKIEDCIEKIIACDDGVTRKLHSFDDKQVTYSVLIGDNHFVLLTPIGRDKMERYFLNGNEVV